MIRSLLVSQRGQGALIALAFTALAVPLVTGALMFASTASIDSRVKNQIVKNHYSMIGASQHAVYRVVYEDGYATGLEPGVMDSYALSLNGEDIAVTVLKISDPVVDPPPPSADSGRRLQTLKEVTPATASPNTLTTFTYTITIENRDDDAENLNKIFDELPTGFSYVDGSTIFNDSPFSNPAISEQELQWNLASLNLKLQPGQSAVLVFDAEADVPEGIYCNEAWVQPGDKKTSTGKSVKVQVGSPASELCEGPTVQVTKTVAPDTVVGNVFMTYTYTISIENIGTDALNLSQTRDMLPDGFSHVIESSTGDITVTDPITSYPGGGTRQRLDWDLTPPLEVPPGETRTLTFEAEATAEPGEYWNEIWATFDEFPDPAYTWPTATVKVMGVFETQATDGQSIATSEIWVGSDSYIIADWNIDK